MNVSQFQTGINYYVSIFKYMRLHPLQITFTNQEFKLNIYTTLSWNMY